jgi:hypothetical protein
VNQGRDCTGGSLTLIGIRVVDRRHGLNHRRRGRWICWIRGWREGREVGWVGEWVSGYVYGYEDIFNLGLFNIALPTALFM